MFTSRLLVARNCRFAGSQNCRLLSAWKIASSNFFTFVEAASQGSLFKKFLIKSKFVLLTLLMKWIFIRFVAKRKKKFHLTVL